MLSIILNAIALIAAVIVLILVVRTVHEKQRLRRKVFNQNLKIIELEHQLSKQGKEYVFLDCTDKNIKKKPFDPKPWLKNDSIYKDYAQDYTDERDEQN